MLAVRGGLLASAMIAFGGRNRRSIRGALGIVAGFVVVMAVWTLGDGLDWPIHPVTSGVADCSSYRWGTRGCVQPLGRTSGQSPRK